MIILILQNAYVLLGIFIGLTCLGFGDLYTTREEEKQSPFPRDKL
jgi:hypothetical protein